MCVPPVQAINGALCSGPAGEKRGSLPRSLAFPAKRAASLRDTLHKGKPDPFQAANVCLKGVSAKAEAQGGVVLADGVLDE